MHDTNTAEYHDEQSPAVRQPHRKFEITRATDPDTLLILHSRDAALGDPALSRPVRAFVCFVIDRALHPGFNDEKGVVCMADSIAAKKFGVTVRTIYDWRHWPGITKYLWFSKKGRPNMWPMMVYHLACLHAAPRLDNRTDADGTYAGGASDRVAPGADVAAIGRERRNAALAAKRAQKTLPLVGGIAVVTGSEPPFRFPKSATFRAISAQARNLFRRMAEENFGPEPKKISAESRRKFRQGAEENFGGEPKKTSAAGRSDSPVPAEADCRHLEPQSRVLSVSNEGEALPPRLAALPELLRADVIAWAKTLPGTFRSKLEKQRSRLEAQRQAMRKSVARDVVAAKIECLDREIDGPLPAYTPPQVTPAAVPQVTEEQFKANGQKLVGMMREAVR